MSAQGIDHVIQSLAGKGYQLLPRQLEVSNVAFDFAATLIGPETSLDLIIVADTLRKSYRELLRHVDALSHALDVVASRRALTVILVGPRPTPEILNSLTTVCRVLPVGVITAARLSDLENWLSIFAPLEVPPPSEATADPLNELRQKAHGIGTAIFEQFAAAAERSASAVELVLAKTLQDALDDVQGAP